MVDWIAIGLLVAALVPTLLAWAGWVRFGRTSGAAARAAGRAFAVLDVGALAQAVAQQVGPTALRWVVSGVGLVLVLLGAVLIFRWRTRQLAAEQASPESDGPALPG